MTGAELTCAVFVDGYRLADTADELLAATPTALTGLTVTWGRETVVDQPDASTCGFTVRDIDGDTDFLGLLHVGRVVDVYAEGSVTVGTDPIEVQADGSFEGGNIGARVRAVNATAADDPRAYDGLHAIRANPTGAAAGRLFIPPAPFSPSAWAWDEIPNAEAGQHWTVRLAVAGTPGASVTLSIGLYSSPTNAPAAVVTAPVAVVLGTDYTVLETSYVDDGSHGRVWVGAVLDFPAAIPWSAGVGTWAAQSGRWVDVGAAWVDALVVLAPPQAQRVARVFTGRITDLEAGPAADAVEVKVTATDYTADLANDAVGDQPWNVETITSRVGRIRSLATTRFAADVDPVVGAYRVSWRDVDSQPVMTLLGELATSADAVLWSAVETTRGFYLWFEDPATRQALGALYWDADAGLVKIGGTFRPGAGRVLSACDVLRDPVTYAQDVTDVITRVDLTWLEQGVDDDGHPATTERHVQEIDAPAEAEYGVRRLGYTTQLVAAADGQAVATRVLVRSRELGWRLSGLTWDTDLPAEFDDDHNETALTLLDGTQRIGLPISVSDLPAWCPDAPTALVYVEGGEYVFDGGRWTLALSVSPAGATGRSGRWVELDPAWQWRQIDPEIQWLDMVGVAATPGIVAIEGAA
jgi:hypothetical protein